MATVRTHSEERRYTPDRRASSYRTAHRRLTALDWTAMVLLIVGGVNWGLIGLFGFNLVAAIFGEFSILSRLVYIIVGIAAIYSVYTSSKMSGKKD